MTEDDPPVEKAYIPPPGTPPLPPGFPPPSFELPDHFYDEHGNLRESVDITEPPEWVNPDADLPVIGVFAFTDDDADAVLRDYWKAGIPVHRAGFDFYVELGHRVGLTAIETEIVSPVAVPQWSWEDKKQRQPWELPAETWTVADAKRRVRTLLFQHPGGVRERRDFGVLTTLCDEERVLVPPTDGCSWKGGPKLSGGLPDMAKRAVVARIARQVLPDDDEWPREQIARRGLHIARTGLLTVLLGHPDQGKTTLLALTSGQLALDDQQVVVLDFEARGDLGPRLQAMGLKAGSVKVFTTPPVGDPGEWAALVASVGDISPTLVAIDGLGRMLKAAGVDFRQVDDVREFLDATVRRWQSLSTAVLVTELPSLADRAAREPRGGVLGPEADLIWSLRAVRPWSPRASGLLRIEAVRDRFGDYVHDPVHHLSVLTDDGPLRMAETEPPPSMETQIDNAIVALVTESPWTFSTNQIVSALPEFPHREVGYRLQLLVENGVVMIDVRPHDEGRRKVKREVYGPGEPS